MCSQPSWRRWASRALYSLALLCAINAPARAERGTARARRGETLALVTGRFDSDRERPHARNLRPPAPVEEQDEDAGETPDDKPLAPALEHRVVAGDTLGAIAKHYGITLEQLSAQNPELDPDHIRIGQTLAIGGGRRHERVTVQPGDTLSSIAKAHGVTLAELTRWNSGLNVNHIRAGAELTVYPKQAPSISESVGTPSSGELLHGHRLPPGRGYAIRASDRAYATDETVRGIVTAFEHLQQHDPRAPRLWVHDLSLHHGGPMQDHKSHQSGRDADIAYPQKQCESGTCDFRRLAPSELDVAREFQLLRYWLTRDMLEAVFIDYRLQAPLYDYARAHGASAEELQRWFQYPHGRDYPLGVIRHFPKHDDHMHVRFACPSTDLECKTFRPLMMHTALR